MDMLNKLRSINEELLVKTADEKYEYIKKILSEEDCFFKIGIDVALDILETLGVEKPYETYIGLIDEVNYVDKSTVKIID